jgi:hypothetical protein
MFKILSVKISFYLIVFKRLQDRRYREWKISWKIKMPGSITLTGISFIFLELITTVFIELRLRNIGNFLCQFRFSIASGNLLHSLEIK